jgi:anti-sigma factor RsiW
MKRFFDPCRGHRRNVSLLAAGALSDGEKDAVEKHLVACADCRAYFVEIKAVAAPLANWAESLTQIQPGESAQRRWTSAIETAAQPNAIRRFAPVAVFRDWAREVIWPWRRVWAGLAAVWILLLAANCSMHNLSQAVAAKSNPTPEMIQAWRQQEQLLAELIGPNETRAAAPPRSFLPRPSSERRIEILMT